MDTTIIHKPLNREEIVALTPTVLYDSPRGGYRLLWGTALLCGVYALYRGGIAALPVLIPAGFYFFCAKRLFWPGGKLDGVSANHGQSGRSGKTGGSGGRTSRNSAETRFLLGVSSGWQFSCIPFSVASAVSIPTE